MRKTQVANTYITELAELFASNPTRKKLLDYRPSKSVQRRAETLLEKQNAGEVSYEERQELEAYAHAERLMRLVKARLRSGGHREQEGR